MISWGRLGNAAVSATVHVAQVVGKSFQLIRSEIRIIQKNVIAGWTTRLMWKNLEWQFSTTDRK